MLFNTILILGVVYFSLSVVEAILKIFVVTKAYADLKECRERLEKAGRNG